MKLIQSPFRLTSLRQSRKAARGLASVAVSMLATGAIAATASLPSALATPDPTPTLIPTQPQTPLRSGQPTPSTQPIQLAQPAPSPVIYQMGVGDFLGPLFVTGIIIVGGAIFFSSITGLVIISEQEVGIIIKKWGGRLTPGHLVALHGEAGIQADTLVPGWHWGYFPWQYTVQKQPVIVVPQGEIALIVANDGVAIPPERILGKVVPCDNFQDARKFLSNGGEKGRQLDFLTAGTYRINTALFQVITSGNTGKHGVSADKLRVYSVQSDKVGIVTTLDGQPIEAGEIAGPTVPGHNNFQNGEKFIRANGRRGLQEQILLSGSWNLNPWFAQVEQVPMTEIPIGYVGVVISFVGKAHEDVSGASFTHGDLVEPGHKGVWTEPLYPGKHPINIRVMKVELVPTTNIVLNWSARTERHNYDQKLESLQVRSRDGFAFDLEIAQIIHVGALDAPKVISRVGSMQNLVDHVLEPTIGNYFRNSAQDYTVLDFLSARSERQAEAAEYIKAALRSYDVQAIDTLIGEIQPPAELMKTQTERKIAEEQRKTFEMQQQAQTQRQQLVRETALADIQQEMVKSEQSVKIAALQAQAQIKQSEGQAESIKLRAVADAESIRATGRARAESYHAGVQALGEKGYTAMQLMQIIGDHQVRLIPDVLVGSSSSGSLVDGLLSMILWNQAGKTPGNGGTPLPSPLPSPSDKQPFNGVASPPPPPAAPQSASLPAPRPVPPPAPLPAPPPVPPRSVTTGTASPDDPFTS